jgi:HEAT repeat protein/beta-lactamase regulating signal transducer with metallopeptidase domain
MSPSLNVAATALDIASSLPVLTGALLKGTALVAIVFAASAILRRSSASLRHLVWTLCFGALLALPLLASTVPWRIELALGATAPAPSAATHKRHAKAPNASQAVAAEPEIATPAPSTTPIEPSPRFDAPSLASVILTLWLVVAALLTVRIAAGIALVSRLTRRAERVTDGAWTTLLDRCRRRIGITRSIALVQSSRVTVPFACGVLRPVVVLPDNADEWSPERREAVLLHELAHVSRRDMLTHLLSQLACALYWFNPLVWAAARRLRSESERACDDLVLRSGTRASEYADHLLSIVRAAGPIRAPVIALAMARRSEFEGRLLAILEPKARRHRVGAVGMAGVVASFVISAVALAAIAPAGAAPVNGKDAFFPGTSVTTTHDTDQTSERTRRETREREKTEEMQLTQGRVSQSRASSALAQALRDESPKVREVAARSLGQLEDHTALDALGAVLSDESIEVRLAAVQALGEIDDPRSVDALLKVLRDDSDPKVREMAAWALGEIEDARAVSGLAAALKSERVKEVRLKIVWALGEIEDAKAVDAVSSALSDDDLEIRKMAVWALGEIESPASVPALIPLLRESDPEMRKQAAWALGEIEDAKAVDALSPVTKDSNAEVRAMAVWALGEIEDARAEPALTAALRDSNLEVRRKAVWALGELDDLKHAPQGLIDALKDEDREVRKSAIHALGEIGDAAAVNGLAAATRDPDLEIKKEAAQALSEIGGTAAIEALVDLLKDSDPEIRRIAAEALGKNR